MAKRGLKLSVPVPNFMSDGPAWRRALHSAIVKVQDRGNVQYSESDKLEVEICFYLKNPKLTVLDLDNRLKDVFDALQGFVGEKGKSGELKPIIPNDSQIYRVIAEKRLAPKVNRAALSTIEIRRYDRHVGTVREPRDLRKHANPKG